LKGVAKALLPLNGKPLLNHWLALFSNNTSTEFYIICNESNHQQFLSWSDANNFPTDRIFNDGSVSNETRNGAVVDIHLAVEHFKLNRSDYDGLLVVAGDTLFLRDFDLSDFLKIALDVLPGTLVTSYTVSDEETKKTGILQLAETSTASYRRVTGFFEKPDPSETTSRVACPCFYHLSSSSLPLLKTFFDEAKARNAKLDEIDATGKFIAWLVHRHPVYAITVSGRLDIGGLASYKQADSYMVQ
jgi:NDP-sugar pyrophosphorylase family protein